MSRKRYMQVELEIIKEWYPLVGAQAVLARLAQLGYNRTLGSLGHKAMKMGLKSPMNWKANSGSFKKGHKPVNKGSKMSSIQYKKAAPTMFKKGRLPHNTKQDGAISIRTDKRTGRSYQYIRLGKGQWKEFHRFLWEETHGPVPPKHCVIFLDGNTMNWTLDNLKMITMRENVIRNRNIEKLKATNAALTDKQVAGRLGMKNPELKAELLKHPELLDLARKKIQLNRAIKNVSNE